MKAAAGVGGRQRSSATSNYKREPDRIMHEAFLIVAIVLFALDGILPLAPSFPQQWRATPIGLAFFAASFLRALGG